VTACTRSAAAINWVKTLTIAGFALDEGKLDGMYFGCRKGEDLIYAGKVDHGSTNIGRRIAQEATARPKDTALCQADRAQGRLG
jgi:bifunctional non-homologous end joining protein LigD